MPIVLNDVKGFKIPFRTPVTQIVHPSNSAFSETELEQLNLAIIKLMELGAVVNCSDVPNKFTSNIFLTPKKDGTNRFILNLKKLNKFIAPQHFKMEDIRKTIKPMSKNCLMSTIDLKYCYFLGSMHNASKQYL